MPGVLDDLRTRREGMYAEMKTLSSAAAMNTEQRARFTTLDTEITELDAELDVRARQAEREARAAASRAAESGGQATDVTDGTRRSGWAVTTEPTTYGRGSGHSYFMDLARDKVGNGDGDGGLTSARDRLRRHTQEIDVDMPKRVERRNAAAQRAYDDAFTRGGAREIRAMERMVNSGVSPFEQRFISRTDGAGGYFVPPLWLIDQYIPYLRAGRDFIDLWRGLPLPAGTDSINIPRVTIGTAVGPQVADGGPVQGRDMTDSFVNARVYTIAGQQDAALQLLDQSPVAFDEIVFADMAADYNMQLSAMGMVGSGTAGQSLGIWPSGLISTASGIYVANTNNTASQTWVNGGGATASVINSVFQASAQILSILARTRLLPPTAWVWHPWLWYYLMSQVDGQQRPLVVPGTPNNVGYNQIAVDQDGPGVSGPVGFYMGLPVVLDPNVPTSFGGTANPYIAAVSAGQFAPTAGTGSNALFTPLVAGRWDDAFLWEGEMRTRVLTEVLSGNLQVRFQIYNYYAMMANRYQAYSAVSTGGTTVAAAGSSVSYATLTQQSATAANSVLNMTGQGF